MLPLLAAVHCIRSVIRIHTLPVGFNVLVTTSSVTSPDLNISRHTIGFYAGHYLVQLLEVIFP